MKIQKKYLEVLFKVIQGYKTQKMVLARVRDSFLRELTVPTEQFIKDRNEIYTKFALKNEDGSPKLNETGNFILATKDEPLSKEAQEELENEISTLNCEEVELKNPSELKNMIEESSYETEAGETLHIDEIIKLL